MTTYHGRRAAAIENEHLRVTVLEEGGHVAEILDKEQPCLENGAREFWVLDTNRRQVKVSTPDGKFVIYKSGQHIPLFFAPGPAISVDEIFA